MAALSILLIVLLVIDIGLRLWQSGSESKSGAARACTKSAACWLSPYGKELNMDKRRKQETQVTSKNNKRINNIEGKPTNLPTSPKQLPLDVGIRVEKSIDGIEMGVLSCPTSHKRAWRKW